jgi:putative PIG3 family NAD(P)H quinone oxidoreductase
VHAITVTEPGEPDALVWSAVADPVPGPGEVLIDVAASAVNRADLLQRRGFYPPPPGASDIIGLECSGTIAALGRDVTGWSVGDEVCALLAGGGYAERVVVPAGQVLPVPRGISVVDAAALPEVTCTVWSNVFMLANLQAGDTFLVHGGSGGIGTMAIQLARRHGARVFTTAGTAAGLDRCRELGADVTINYRDEDFVERVAAETHGRGVDVILDNMGGSYLPRNVAALATNGRSVTIGLQGGTKGELDVGLLLTKRASVHATALRARPVEEKSAVVAAVREHVWPAIESGEVRPVIDRAVPMERAADAHRAMEAGGHLGKIMLLTPAAAAGSHSQR